jgi:hypothetical protein
MRREWMGILQSDSSALIQEMLLSYWQTHLEGHSHDPESVTG